MHFQKKERRNFEAWTSFLLIFFSSLLIWDIGSKPAEITENNAKDVSQIVFRGEAVPVRLLESRACHIGLHEQEICICAHFSLFNKAF